jgi:hypothetical protein
MPHRRPLILAGSPLFWCDFGERWFLAGKKCPDPGQNSENRRAENGLKSAAAAANKDGRRQQNILMPQVTAVI